MKIAYNKNTGEIVACGTHIDHMSSNSISLIEGECNPGKGYVFNNCIIPFTSIEEYKYRNRPKYSSQWDNNIMSWIDTRTDVDVRNHKYTEITAIAQLTDFSSIEIGGYVYTADNNSRSTMAQKLLIATILNKESSFVIEWYLKDGTSIDLSFYQLKEVLSEIENRSDRIFKMKKKLKEKIFNSNIEIVKTIRWPDFI